ncbi:MAG: hypothetical protein IKG42_04460 [Clostridia bacterium]|nr:hypothetical protein [Clostridia bacterium]
MFIPNLNLFSINLNDINNFLSKFYSKNITSFSNQNCKLNFENPTELVSILSAIIDNNETFKITAWLNLDNETFIKVTENNLDEIIKYLYERYPY